MSAQEIIRIANELAAKGIAPSTAMVKARLSQPVPMAELLAAVARSPALARQHQLLASLRFRIMLQHLALHGANSAKRRVSHHLLGLLNSYGRPTPEGMLISIPFTQQEMGNICGLSRVSVSHVFTLLESDGVIARAGRLIVVRELERLREMART